jgi:hypothetical protein
MEASEATTHCPTDGRLTRPRLPWALRAIDALGGRLERLGLLRFPMDEEALCAIACRQTGLKDFGDERFRLGLRQQIEGQRVFERFPFISRLALRFLTLRALRNRLLIEEQIAAHPEILQERIVKPLVIVSFGRMGTTLLQNLLAQDPAGRSLANWEAAAPARPKASGVDPRLRRARRQVWLLKHALPKLGKLHTFEAEGPQECGVLLRNAFYRPDVGQSPRAWLQQLTPEWMDWAYGQYRRQLQLLQWQRPAPGHWLLKWPLHSIAIETLLRTFPDAVIVQTHRDPIEVIPSVCQVAAQLTFFLGDERWAEVPRELMLFIADVLRRGIEARQRIPAGRVLDVQFRDLVREPIATLRRIYEHAGYPFSDEVRRRAEQWLAAHPKPKREKDYYDLRQFGLDAAEVDATFAFYRDYFQIPRA